MTVLIMSSTKILSIRMRDEQVAWMRVEAHAKKYLKLR